MPVDEVVTKASTCSLSVLVFQQVTIEDLDNISPCRSGKYLQNGINQIGATLSLVGIRKSLKARRFSDLPAQMH